MAYKRYFKRNGKVFGPYYYESYRDENGDVKKRYIGKVNPDKKKISVGKLVLGGLVLLFLVAVVSVSFQLSGGESFSFGDAELDKVVDSVKGFASNSMSRIVGLVVEDTTSSEDSSSEVVEDSQPEVVEVVPQEEEPEVVEEVVEEIKVGILGGLDEIPEDKGQNVSVDDLVHLLFPGCIKTLRYSVFCYQLFWLRNI